MNTWQAQVRVWLKPSVFDPQGHAVEQALVSLGQDGIERVRIGKYMELTVTAADRTQAEEKVRQACERVLCNPVMETYAFTLVAAEEQGQPKTPESVAAAEVQR
jgi:phosphoribosylformylglycinamidine synthase PurS subunit